MYIPKDYWMVCDRCGGVYRRSEMRKEWTGLWVCKRGCWEPRHPQDFVKTKIDEQAVEVARPDTDSDILTTTLASNVSKDATSIVVSSYSGILQYSSIGITLDDGTVFQTYTDEEPTSTTIAIATPIWGDAASGNTVYIYAHSNDTYLTDDLDADDY